MSQKPERRWRWVDYDPDYEPEFSRTPDSVEHEVDFATHRYDWTAWFTNPEIWAESDTSRASRHFEIQRVRGGWRVRLIGRNHSTFDVPREWEPAPPVLARAWGEVSKRS